MQLRSFGVKIFQLDHLPEIKNMLRAKLYKNHITQAFVSDGNYYVSLEILTNDPDKFAKWCWNHNQYVSINHRSSMNRAYNKKFRLIKIFYKPSCKLDELIEKHWGIYRPERDDLSLPGRIKYDLKYYFGSFEPLSSNRQPDLL